MSILNNTYLGKIAKRGWGKNLIKNKIYTPVGLDCVPTFKK